MAKGLGGRRNTSTRFVSKFTGRPFVFLSYSFILSHCVKKYCKSKYISYLIFYLVLLKEKIHILCINCRFYECKYSIWMPSLNNKLEKRKTWLYMDLHRLGCLSMRQCQAEEGRREKTDDVWEGSQLGSSIALILKISIIFSSDAVKISIAWLWTSWDLKALDLKRGFACTRSRSRFRSPW